MQHNASVRLIRRKNVCDRLDISDSTSRRAEAAGLLPPPVEYINSCKGWPEHEIDAIARAIIAGKTQDELRALVVQLVAARAEAVSS
jgi:prophage regulatory protein